MSYSDRINTVKSEIDALINSANTTTGASDAKISNAVQSLIDGYGGGSLDFQIELIAQVTIALDELVHVDSSVSDTTDTGIVVNNTDCEVIIITVDCDSEITTTTEWGYTISLCSRYTTNKNIKCNSDFWCCGTESLKLSEMVNSQSGTSSYGLNISSNTSTIQFRRKTWSTSVCPKFRGGNYTLRAYGVISK